MIILPTHICRDHWVLAVAHMKKRELEIIDSLQGEIQPIEAPDLVSNEARSGIFTTSQAADHLAWWLGWMEEQALGEKAPPEPWTARSSPYAAKQKDDHNCGIFTIANALSVVMTGGGCGDIDPKAWRKWLAMELLAQGDREGLHTKACGFPPGGRAWHARLGAPQAAGGMRSSQ